MINGPVLSGLLDHNKRYSWLCLWALITHGTEPSSPRGTGLIRLCSGAISISLKWKGCFFFKKYIWIYIQVGELSFGEHPVIDLTNGVVWDYSVGIMVKKDINDTLYRQSCLKPNLSGWVDGGFGCALEVVSLGKQILQVHVVMLLVVVWCCGCS